MNRTGGVALKIIGVLFALVIIGGVLAYLNRGSLAAFAFEAFVERHSGELGLQPAEQQAIAEPLGELGRRTAEGDMTPDQLELILAEFSQQPAAAILAVRGFSHRQVANRQKSAADIAAEQLICHRFNHALQADSVSNDTIEQLTAIAVEQQTDENGKPQYRIKEHLTDAEIDQCLEIMRTSADAAGIPAEVSPLNIKQLVRQSLNQSLSDQGLEPLSSTTNE